MAFILFLFLLTLWGLFSTHDMIETEYDKKGDNDMIHLSYHVFGTHMI